MTVAALLLAAGRGERLGGDVPKAFVRLEGEMLLVRSLATLQACTAIDIVVPVLPAGDHARLDEVERGRFRKLAEPVDGGAERQDSVAAGLAALPRETELVAVHDAARCLVSRADVERVVAAAARSGAAILAEPVRDTVKRVAGGVIRSTVPRAECWAAQTPQVFRVELLREAVEKARAEGFLGTDDAQLVERLGAPVEVVAATGPNPKITVPSDLAAAAAWLREVAS